MNKNKNREIYFICCNVKESPNSAGNQRAKFLSENYKTTLFVSSDVDEGIKSKFHRVITFRNPVNLMLLSFLYLLYARMFRKSHAVVYTQYTMYALVVGWYAKVVLGYPWIYDLWDHPSLGFQLNAPGLVKNIKATFCLRLAVPLTSYADTWLVTMNKGILEHLPKRKSQHALLLLRREISEFKQDAGSGIESIRVKKPLKFITSGWASKARGIDAMVRLVKELGAQGIDCELNIFGKYDSYSEKVVQKHNVESSNLISLRGYVPIQDIYTEGLKSHFGLCILDRSVTNYLFAYPIKVVEYMSYGVIPICTRTPATEEMIGGITDEFLVENDTIFDVVKQITMIIEDEIRHADVVESLREEYSKYKQKNNNSLIAEEIERLGSL